MGLGQAWIQGGGARGHCPPLTKSWIRLCRVNPNPNRVMIVDLHFRWMSYIKQVILGGPSVGLCQILKKICIFFSAYFFLKGTGADPPPPPPPPHLCIRPSPRKLDWGSRSGLGGGGGAEPLDPPPPPGYGPDLNRNTNPVHYYMLTRTFEFSEFSLIYIRPQSYSGPVFFVWFSTMSKAYAEQSSPLAGLLTLA